MTEESPLANHLQMDHPGPLPSISPVPPHYLVLTHTPLSIPAAPIHPRPPQTGLDLWALFPASALDPPSASTPIGPPYNCPQGRAPHLTLTPQPSPTPRSPCPSLCHCSGVAQTSPTAPVETWDTPSRSTPDCGLVPCPQSQTVLYWGLPRQGREHLPPQRKGWLRGRLKVPQSDFRKILLCVHCLLRQGWGRDGGSTL